MRNQQETQTHAKKGAGEIVRDYLDAYAAARKRDKGWLLDEIMILTGWSRDHARRRLAQLAKGEEFGAPGTDESRGSRCKYSAQSRAVLERVWDWSGRLSGKYLAAVMAPLLESLERHGALVPGRDGYSESVREELLSVSPASIDRYLQSVRAGDVAGRGVSTRRLPNPSVEFLEFASGPNEAEPGFFIVDTIAHAGPTVARNCLFTFNAICLHTGWVFTRSLEDNEPDAAVDLLRGCLDEVEGIPFWVNAIELSNADEGVHATVAAWAAALDIHFSPLLKDHRRDRLPEASRHQHLVHEYGSICRYDTEEARHVLNQLWRAVDDRLNYFTPTRKPTGWVEDARGRRRRIYDAPATPFARLCEAGVMSPGQEEELHSYSAGLDPAAITTEIAFWQKRLQELAA